MAEVGLADAGGTEEEPYAHLTGGTGSAGKLNLSAPNRKDLYSP